MILAAPLVIPFAEAIGLSVATLGIAKASDMVNEYIQENPEQSMKIFQMIMPSQGIANILKNKSSDEEVEEDVEVEEVDTRDLTRAEKAKMMKELAKSGGGNMREKMKKGYEEIIQPGESDRELDDAEDRYDGGVEDAPKPKFDYKKFFKKRYANGGGVGSMMKPKRGLVNEPGGYAGLTTQQEALLYLQLQNDPEFQTGFYKSTPELSFEDFYKAPTGPLRYVDEVEGSSSYFDENLDGLKFEPKGPLRDLDEDRTIGIIDSLNTKDPSGELSSNYIDRIKTTSDGGIYETIQANTPKFAEFQQTPISEIDVTPANFKNLKSTNKKGVYGYTTLPGISPPEYGTKFQTENNPIYLNKNLADFITTKPMSPANQFPLYSDEAAQLGFYGAKPADILNQAVDTIQHEYAHNITKYPQFKNVMKNTMDAGIPSGLQLKGKPGDGISKHDKEELFIRALDIERRLQKDGNLMSPNVDIDLSYMNQVLDKKYKNLNNNGQSMAIQYLNAVKPQVKDYFNVINQQGQLANTAAKARAANPNVYASSDAQGFTSGGGGFASQNTGTNSNFSNKTGKGRTGYDGGGRVGLFMGGSPLDGQALAIYNSMNAYGFDDQAIANALTEQGLYTAPGDSTPDTPDTTPGNTMGLQTGSDNFSVYNPDPNSIKPFKPMGANFQNQKPNAFSTGIAKMMDNPVMKTLGFAMNPPLAFAKGILSKAGSMMPVNERSIFENLAGNQGVRVDDIGRIVNTGKYNTPEGVMAGYNLNQVTDKTFDKRTDRIEKTLSEKYGLTAEEIEDVKAGTYTGKKGFNTTMGTTTNLFSQLRNILSAKNTILGQQNIAAQMAKQQREAKAAADALAIQQSGLTDLGNIQKIQQYTGQPLSDYRMSRPASERNYTGGSTNSNPSTPGAQDGFSNKSGMGRTGYSDGGLVTMFKEKR